MSSIKKLLNMSRRYTALANPEVMKVVFSIPRKRTHDTQRHLSAAAEWISTAQDAFDDGGVARSYSLVYNPFFGKKGWVPSYPETTGYIIPTFFDYAALANSDDIRGRAIRMADWECAVQLPNGAVQGGTVGPARPTPAIFNTGQVIFGWVRAYIETRDKKYLDSATRAGDYLIELQDQDGAWRKNLSDYATDAIDTYTYNTRTAWSLLRLFSVTGRERFRDAAAANIEYALTQQMPNGWFMNNCLSDPKAPLLHTIAYSIRGILESGVLTETDRYVAAAKKSADELIKTQAADGGLPGRLDKNWEATVKYSCLTGVAQTGIIWGRLHQITGDVKYLDALKKSNGYLKSVQILDAGNRCLHGGISGSFPIHGAYGQFEILNWAVKFFMDSLMIEESITKGRRAAFSVKR